MLSAKNKGKKGTKDQQNKDHQNKEHQQQQQQQQQQQSSQTQAKQHDEEVFVVNLRRSTLMMRKLGKIALESLEKGEPVRDEIQVHLITEKIKTLPSDKGWLIDGFPVTYNQAKLLEKALTGFDEDNQVKKKAKPESILAPNPKPEPPQPKHKSPIDLIINLTLNVIKRSNGRMREFCFLNTK